MYITDAYLRIKWLTMCVWLDKGKISKACREPNLFGKVESDPLPFEVCMQSLIINWLKMLNMWEASWLVDLAVSHAKSLTSPKVDILCIFILTETYTMHFTSEEYGEEREVLAYFWEECIFLP